MALFGLIGSSKSNDENPLANFSRTGFMIKHVLKKALMFGAVGGVGLGVAAAGATVAAGVAGPIGMAMTAITAGLGQLGIGGGVSGVVGDMALGAGQAGLLAGGALGLVFGGTSASQAADAEEARLIAQYEQGEARKDRNYAVAQRRRQQEVAMAKQAQQYGLSPNAGLPYRGGADERTV